MRYLNPNFCQHQHHLSDGHCPHEPPPRHSFFTNTTPTATCYSPPRKLVNDINHALRHGWAESTLTSYNSDVQKFYSFCNTEHIPPSLRFPTDEFVLCAYAASQHNHVSGNTIRKRISALKAWHAFHNLTWHGGKRLHYVLNGVCRLSPVAPHPPRLPVNQKMISLLRDNLNLSSPLDAAVYACAAVAFWGQCRLGELLPRSAKSSSSCPTRSHFRISYRNHSSRFLHLPQTKTAISGQDVVLLRTVGTTNPVSALKHHLSINNLPSTSTIFNYISGVDAGCLTCDTFLSRCNEIWHRFGYPRVTGHSFRIGGTTELLISGVPPHVVKAMGRWKSDAFMKYWRSLDDIAPLHTSHIAGRRHQTRRTT